ncbi:MAG TPA: hypothetical protein VFF73_25980 [Planctomycetota bacterium]|nr:hypothetical protein [Planctomycetota bacterium]
MLLKFTGDKMSLEARSDDGKRWEVTLFDRGQVTKYVDATEAEVRSLAAEKKLRAEPKR